jgi:hypothetical protein
MSVSFRSRRRNRYGMRPSPFDGMQAVALRLPRSVFLGALLVGLLVESGCGTVEFDVPPGRDVRLLEQDEPVSVSVSQKIWYALWGQEPLSNNSTAPLIEEHNLREVRMATEQTLFDNVVSTILGILSFSVRTMYVEGNP